MVISIRIPESRPRGYTVEADQEGGLARLAEAGRYPGGRRRAMLVWKRKLGIKPQKARTGRGAWRCHQHQEATAKRVLC